MNIINKIKKSAITSLATIVIGLTGCPGPSPNNDIILPPPGLSDPSVLYCEGLGYENVQVTDPIDGSQYGICRFPDSTECKVWDFFEGKCGQQYTLCETTGGVISTTDQGCTFSPECAVCDIPSGNTCYEWDYFIGICN